MTLHDAEGTGYAVRKRGRTTRLTSGHITNIHYSGPRTDGWQFRDQLYITSDTADNFSAGGDSGSLVVNANRQVVGLLWGGGTHDTYGVASPIAAVMAELDIEMFHRAIPVVL